MFVEVWILTITLVVSGEDRSSSVLIQPTREVCEAKALEIRGKSPTNPNIEWKAECSMVPLKVRLRPA